MRPEVPATLREIVDALGGLVRVAAAPRGLDVVAGAPAILEPGTALAREPDRILFAVGAAARGGEAARIVEEAAAAGAAAVVFRGEAGELRDSPPADVAVLMINSHLPWEQALSLFNAAAAAGSDVGVGEGSSRAPIEDLYALADAAAAAIGGAVSIEDPHGRVLAYSTLENQTVDELRRGVILRRQAPNLPAVRAAYRDSLKTADPVRIDAIDGFDILPRLVVPVRASGETLGFLWAIEGDAPLGAEARRSLSQAARLAALSLLKARAGEDVERTLRAQTLRALLEGRSVADAGSALGVEGECAVMAFELPPCSAPDYQLQRSRLVDLIAFYCDAYHRRVACTEVGEMVYALVEIGTPAHDHRLGALAENIAETVEQRLHVAPLVGVGSVVGQHDAARSRREADRVLDVLKAKPQTKTARIDDVLADAIVMDLHEVAGATLDRGPLRALLDQSPKRRAVLVATLRAYLGAFGDVPVASARAGVHQNTFRYRLGGVLELMDLSDPDQRLLAELQLRTLDLRGDSKDARRAA